MNLERVTNFILRSAVAFAFLYPPIDAIFDPYSWIGYLPHFIRGFVPDLVLLHSFGVLEVIIALWILSGRKILLPSLLALAILVAIILLNLQDFQIIFRDIPIAMMSGILALNAFFYDSTSSNNAQSRRS